MGAPKSVVFYSYATLALGSIHTSLCRQLQALGWRAELKDWTVGRIIGDFHAELMAYDRIVTLPFGGTRPLTNPFEQKGYGIPPEKISIVSHGEEDIHRLLAQGGPEIFERFAAYAVVSDTLACSSLSMGIRRVPKVLRLGVDVAAYGAPPAKRLDKVGYASLWARRNPWGLEQKRGVLAQEAAEAAGLRFSKAEQIPFAEMPAWYRSIDALIMPSLQEGAGLPPLEAAAASRLVIGTPVGHFPRLAHEGLGILGPLDADRFRAFAAEQLVYYRDNPAAYVETCAAIGEAAKGRDWSRVVGDWIEFLD